MIVTFVKGQSGNPGGRRKEKLFSDALTLALTEDPRRIRALASKLVHIAIHPDSHPVTALRAIGMIADRLEGRPTQQIHVHDETALIGRQELVDRLAELQDRILAAQAGTGTPIDDEAEPQDPEDHLQRLTLPATSVRDVTPKRGRKGST